LVRKPRFALRGKQRVWVQITNCSDIDFYLESAGEVSEVMTSKVLVLPAQKTALLEVRGRGEVAGEKRKVKVPFRVTNLLVRPDEPLLTSFTFEVEFLK
ncbi:MAG: Sb-PDE family phosphodiesterase, partial [Verrucomicrobiae bacterium]|nr:Sb-PDE family phosphodiesterase [Verrucomicrobiae bacterium]